MIQLSTYGWLQHWKDFNRINLWGKVPHTPDWQCSAVWTAESEAAASSGFLVQCCWQNHSPCPLSLPLLPHVHMQKYWNWELLLTEQDSFHWNLGKWVVSPPQTGQTCTKHVTQENFQKTEQLSAQSKTCRKCPIQWKLTLPLYLL